MNSTLCRWPKGRIVGMLRTAGAVAVGCARAEYISTQAAAQMAEWLEAGRHGTMEWLKRHAALRVSPENVFPGVRTVVCAAFPYADAKGYGHKHIADYALGEDYHIALRRRLAPVTERIMELYGAPSRICIDTAPLAERYWATMCGLGRCGRSGQFIVPGAGAGVFLATILTTLELEADGPMTDFDPCGECRRCIEACPGGAIGRDGTLDSRRCLSYLTIEHRGEWPAEAPRRGGRLYGCDICRRVCPHTLREAEPLDELRPRQELMGLTPEMLTPGLWRRLTRSRKPGSAMSRLPYSQLSITLKQP